MLRRKPTRIELKLENMNEYTSLHAKKEPTNTTNSSTTPPWSYKVLMTNNQTAQERIGYVQEPRNPS